MDDNALSYPVPEPLLLERYFAHECTPAEVGDIEAWIAAHPEGRAFVEAMRLAWIQTGDPSDLPVYDVDVGWRRLAARSGDRAVAREVMGTDTLRLMSRETPAPSATAGGVRKLFRPWAENRKVWGAAGLGVAASAAILLCAVGGAEYLLRDRREGQLAVRTSRGSVSMNEIVTVRGQRATLRLTDGSRVTLGVASRLRYPRDFGVTTRELELEGEAYFDVMHNVAMPFRVRTAHGTTEDIGTKFAVRDYPGETASRVVVSEGIVAVGRKLLHAGDVARVAPGMYPVIRQHQPVDRLLSWTAGQLEFVNVPLRDAVADLERWYDVTIRVDDPLLAQQPVTGTFREASVDDVLASFSRAGGIRIERRGRTRTLIPTVVAPIPPVSHP